ncbi:ABC transporter ATP-binding protein [Arcanobacterium canis]
MSLFELRNITRTYEVKPPLEVLRGVDLRVDPGERIAIIGRSGAGKSTLLNIMGILDAPTSGEYLLNSQHVEKMSERERDSVRARTLGFIFQDFHVLPHRTVTENLELKLAISSIPTPERAKLVSEALELVDLTSRRHSPTRLLSGGEKQRLAIARAVITAPQVILADEPTGNLDHANANAVLELFNKQAQKDVAIVVITHDPRMSTWADRVLTLDEGKLHEDTSL